MADNTRSLAGRIGGLSRALTRPPDENTSIARSALQSRDRAKAVQRLQRQGITVPTEEEIEAVCARLRSLRATRAALASVRKRKAAMAS